MKAWHWKQITSEPFTQKGICGCQDCQCCDTRFPFFPFPRLARVRTRKVGEHPVISSSLNRFCPQMVTCHVVFFSDQVILSTQKTHLASWQWDLHIQGVGLFSLSWKWVCARLLYLLVFLAEFWCWFNLLSQVAVVLVSYTEKDKLPVLMRSDPK
jgi:hypothetical protein